MNWLEREQEENEIQNLLIKEVEEENNPDYQQYITIIGGRNE